MGAITNAVEGAIGNMFGHKPSIPSATASGCLIGGLLGGAAALLAGSTPAPAAPSVAHLTQGAAAASGSGGTEDLGILITGAQTKSKACASHTC